MKSLITLIFINIFIAIFMLYASTAVSNPTNNFELNYSSSIDESKLPVNLDLLVKSYDFDWVEEYIDLYYGNYYKSWEKYLTSKHGMPATSRHMPTHRLSIVRLKFKDTPPTAIYSFNKRIIMMLKVCI